MNLLRLPILIKRFIYELCDCTQLNAFIIVIIWDRLTFKNYKPYTYEARFFLENNLGTEFLSISLSHMGHSFF